MICLLFACQFRTTTSIFLLTREFYNVLSGYQDQFIQNLETQMISQAAEYSLRAVLCVARSPAAPLTNQQIADPTKIPAGYLAKILQALARAGLVSSQRGPNGGFLLATDPTRLTLLDIVRVTDPSHRIGKCPLGIHGPHLCSLHRRLDDAAAAVESVLERTTLGQLVAEQKNPFAADATCVGKEQSHD
jgi:Rrf2 family protein